MTCVGPHQQFLEPEQQLYMPEQQFYELDDQSYGPERQYFGLGRQFCWPDETAKTILWQSESIPDSPSRFQPLPETSRSQKIRF